SDVCSSDLPSERSAPISERLRESGTNLQHWTILQAIRHCWPPSHPASLLLRRLFSTTRSTVQLTLGNYFPPSKLCSTLLLLPQLLTSLPNFASFFTEQVAAIGKHFDQRAAPPPPPEGPPTRPALCPLLQKKTQATGNTASNPPPPPP